MVQKGASSTGINQSGMNKPIKAEITFIVQKDVTSRYSCLALFSIVIPPMVTMYHEDTPIWHETSNISSVVSSNGLP